MSSGTYYLRARYYDPATSRMLSEDSVWSSKVKLGNGQEIDDPLSLNLYTYCGNNPVNFVDPSGHLTQQDKDLYINGKITYDQFKVLKELGKKYNSIDQLKDLSDEEKALAKKEIHELAEVYRGNGYHWNSIGDNRMPDFWSLTLNGGSVVGVTVVITWDNRGNLYKGVGLNAGKSATFLSGSFTANWIMQLGDPTEEQLEGYCAGWGINAGGGFGLGGGFTKVPGQDNSVFGIGVYSPQVGASAVYSHKSD